MDVITGRDRERTMLIALGYSNEEIEEKLKMARTSTVTDVAKQIADEKGITLHHAYKLARREAEHEPIPTTLSTKDQILEALYRINANAGISAQGLADQLKLMSVKTNMTQVTALLWDLQKQEHVKFVEQHFGGGSQLTKIRLTPAGRTRILGKRAAIAAEARKDGPIEVVHPPKAEPEIVPSTPYKVPKPGNPLNQNQKAPFPVTDETSPYDVPAAVVDGKLAEADGSGKDVASTDTHTQYRIEITAANYPILESLLKLREEKKDAQAGTQKMLDAAAMIADIDPKTADELTEKAAKLEGRPYQNWEREVLRYIDEIEGR